MPLPFRVLIASALACAAMPAAAQTGTSLVPSPCRLRIDSTGTNWLIQGYDPFSGNASTGTFDVMFFNEGDAECRIRPIFQTDGSPSGLQAEGQANGRRIGYTLLDTYGQYDATPLGGRTVLRVTNRAVVIAPHSQQLVRYVVNVAAAEIPGDGLYSQRLFLQATDTEGAPIAAQQLVVGIAVAPSATMGLTGAFRRTGSQADVDLGELTEGVPAIPLALRVQSTRGYRLGVQSLNGGFLKLAGTDWSVPYQLQIDGRSVALGSNGGVSMGARGVPGMRTDVVPITFRIGNAEDRRAGTYSDVLTMTVSVD